MIMPVFCIIACVFSFLLPEQMESVSLNLDYLGNLNRENLLFILKQKNLSIDVDSQQQLHPEEPVEPSVDQQLRQGFQNREDMENNMMANDLIEIINIKNFARHGKINPIYYEEKNSP